MIENWLDSLSSMIGQTPWLAALLALFAGVLTSVMPCALSNVPLVIGYVRGTGQKDTRRVFWLSLTFSARTAVTFTVLGVVASAAGKPMETSAGWWNILLRVLMVLMALQIWEIFNFIPSTNLLPKNTRRGFLGAFAAGILGGVFSSPCATPVLIVLLGILAGGGNLAWGIVLVLCYSIGHSALVMVTGTSIGFVQKINSNEKYKKTAAVLKIVMGAAILLIGLYMFWVAF